MPEVENKVSGWSKMWKFIGDVFRDNEGHPSMNRVLSFLYGIAAVAFGIIMLTRTANQQVLNIYEFWLTVIFAVIAMLGKNIQKIVEMAVEKKLK